MHTRKVTRKEWKSYYERAERIVYERSLLVPAIEERFFKLLKAGQKYGYDTDRLIERPDPVGSTVFEAASQFSVKICQYILSRNISVNNVLANFVFPVFNVAFETKIWEQMLEKGVNPKVISGEDFRKNFLFTK